MNAVEFVKEYGWEEAKKAIAKVAWCETAYCTMIKHGCFKSNSDCCVDITDLKRLVDSWELVEKYGGLENAKQDEKMANDLGFGHNGLKHAIIDVESCL